MEDLVWMSFMSHEFVVRGISMLSYASIPGHLAGITCQPPNCHRCRAVNFAS